MRIITVNIPKMYLRAIDKLTGRQGLFPSRSELIRVAVREFLICELATVEQYQQKEVIPAEPAPIIDEKLFVQVPMNVGEITTYKTFKLVDKS